MLARWTVTYGPEFEACRAKWRMRSARFDMHLGAIRFALERDPYGYSTPFASEHQRVMESTDYVTDAFVMTAFVCLHPERLVAEVMWVELRPLPAEQEDDDD